MAALDGTLYGATIQGGDFGFGTVFRIATDSTATKLFALSGNTGATRGSDPLGGLHFGPDGPLYGATAYGGGGGGGTVYRIRGLGPHVGTGLPAFTPGTVTLQGSAQTGGEQVNVSFEYGTTPALGSTLGATASSVTSPVHFFAPLEGFGPGSTVHFRAVATSPVGTSLGVVRTFVVPTPFDAWRMQFFGNTTVSAIADTDGDGNPNLAEYGMLTNPAMPDPVAGLAATINTYAEGRRLSTIVARDPARTDITIEVQVGDDPNGPWMTLAASAGGNPFAGIGYVGGDSAAPGLKAVEIRDVVNVSETPQRFLRVHVSLP
jgi:uncharacterized repeat protein (TIGR03803 family)